MPYNKKVYNFKDSPLAPLIKTAQLRRYPKGQIILYEGETLENVYVVRSGTIKIYDIDDQGNEKILHLIPSPAVFPMNVFLADDDEIRWFYGTAVDSEVYVVPREDARALLKTDNVLANHLLTQLAHEKRQLMGRLGSMGKSTANEKLIATLKFLATHHAEDRPRGWRRVKFPVSHQLLADIMGVTRESTTMTVKDLHREKLLRYPRLTVLEVNYKKLNEL
jgi:CRP/FNR family cyclic AMP-dependent transcriptional regulator